MKFFLLKLEKLPTFHAITVSGSWTQSPSQLLLGSSCNVSPQLTKKILLFLSEANEQMKQLKTLSTIFFWSWIHRQNLVKEAKNLRRKLMLLTNY